ncbi:MAG: 4Fe-4S dicluster domain-containing protein [Treponema sp.]|jgi:ferredoxin|nr:4Fe-4S dicluster domain-containing protein [Treponema sp.]
MQNIKNAADLQAKMIERAKQLLADGTVNRVIGWEQGLFDYDITPAVFTGAADLDRKFVYNVFCAANVSKYLVKESAKEGKILAFLKPNDTYSFNELLKEHRVKRENVFIIGIPCNEEIKEVDGRIADDAEPCEYCLGKKHVVYDELLGLTQEEDTADPEKQNAHRFDDVAELEAKSSDERYAFWRKELSKCIRCNACRNVCPACTCIQCIFDNPDSGVQQRVAADSFEENQFHIIRAYHVAGRCTDCGECSRVCPEHIPLHLLNRKFIKDINDRYGVYQAGADLEEKAPLTSYTESDVDPSIVYKRTEGGAR